MMSGVEVVGVGGGAVQVVKRGQATISSRSSAMDILLAGLHSKILLRMESSSGDRGRIFRKKFGSRK